MARGLPATGLVAELSCAFALNKRLSKMAAAKRLYRIRVMRSPLRLSPVWRIPQESGRVSACRDFGQKIKIAIAFAFHGSGIKRYDGLSLHFFRSRFPAFVGPGNSVPVGEEVTRLP